MDEETRKQLEDAASKCCEAWDLLCWHCDDDQSDWRYWALADAQSFLQLAKSRIQEVLNRSE